MRRTLERLLRATDAQDLAEYGIALAVVATGVGAVALAIGASTNGLWTRALQTVITIVLGG
jgi:hypothetical protein